MLVDKSVEAVAAVYDRDQFHGAEASEKNLYHTPRQNRPD